MAKDWQRDPSRGKAFQYHAFMKESNILTWAIEAAQIVPPRIGPINRASETAD